MDNARIVETAQVATLLLVAVGKGIDTSWGDAKTAACNALPRYVDLLRALAIAEGREVARRVHDAACLASNAPADVAESLGRYI